MKSPIPDVNVWLALHLEAHPHHAAADRWLGTVEARNPLVFCRLTQLGLFRLLSTQSVMDGDTYTMRECWQLFEKWIEGGRAELWHEPPALNIAFRSGSNIDERSPKRWSDAYLSAFAQATDLTLVTFDQALAGKTRGAVLLV